MDRHAAAGRRARRCGDQLVSAASRATAWSRGDQRLDGVAADRRRGEGELGQRGAFGDQVAIPEGVRSWSSRSTMLPSGAVRVAGARLVQQQQRQQPVAVGGRLQLLQKAGEADGFVAEVLADEGIAAARRIALVEDEIDGVEHGIEPGGPFGRRRHLVGQRRVADPVPWRGRCAGQSLRAWRGRRRRSPRWSARRPRAG